MLIYNLLGFCENHSPLYFLDETSVLRVSKYIAVHSAIFLNVSRERRNTDCQKHIHFSFEKSIIFTYFDFYKTNLMERKAIFPGSFDPITRGHESIAKRAILLFDEVIIAIGENLKKGSFFSLDKRISMIKKVFENEAKIKVMKFEGLTVNFCREMNAKFILRGLRTSADFEFERSIGQINKKLDPGIETVFLLTDPEYTALNSSRVREIINYGGDISEFVPNRIIQDIKNKS